MLIQEDEVFLVLEIKVHEIKGFCHVYKKDDRIIVENPKVVLGKTDAL